jgi:hypothetical protein
LVIFTINPKSHFHHSMALPKPFPNNPRKITPERLAALGESLIEFGDLSAIVINVGKGRYKNCIVSANQRSKHIPLDEITWTLEHDNPTAAGTVREGYVLHGGERFAVREVSWNEKKCEIANLRANNYGGQNDATLLKFFDDEVLRLGGVSMVFENSPVQFNQQDALPDFERTEGEPHGHPEQLPVDYSAKNKEIDVDALESTMTICMKFNPDDYWKAREQLSKIAPTAEQAVWKLLGNE